MSNQRVILCTYDIIEIIRLFTPLLQERHVSHAITALLELCLNDLYYWCCLNGLALNPDKTDSILLGTRQRANSYTGIATVKVANPTPVLHSRIRSKFLELLLTVTLPWIAK